MIENELDIQTISTKRTDFQADRVLLFRHVTQKEERADPSHFLKSLLDNRTNGTFGFARNTNQPFAKPTEPFFIQCIAKGFAFCTLITTTESKLSMAA
ncbi:hypothetical protein [Pedobacter puniceum]|uniref:Uncharacterized protein n=1 Tax=Pedobacter puniceum TaxID=2666136 RepID=A0A7K0FKX4_9SPHI|nr:hypothetical protein [Pedobacter puniceum]MRX46563.1 hypothetical protein [Pedobacter puniceum]